MIETYNLKMPHSVFSGKNALENISAILKEKWMCVSVSVE